MKHLFIGGCLDGQWREADGEPVRVPVPNPMPTEEQFADKAEVEYQHYTPTHFMMDDVIVTVYSVANLAAVGIFRKLLRDYHPKLNDLLAGQDPLPPEEDGGIQRYEEYARQKPKRSGILR